MRFLCTIAVLATPSVALATHPAPLKIKDAEAKIESEMKPYVELVEHSSGKIPMVPIRGGTFEMGSPETEEYRNDDEGPLHKVEISPFWMGKFEVTWDAYEVWMSDIDIFRRAAFGQAPNERDKISKQFQVSMPTKPYCDMSFGMGKRGYPAICMTQHAARTFCKWLSAKTGRHYRLPTEAEWEYACRAGTKTAYSFGNDAKQLDAYAWYYDNAGDKYQKVGKKKPNPWGLYDMHGNVAEWVLDQYTEDYLAVTKKEGVIKNPLAIPRTLYPRVVRGGGWDHDPEQLRSAARIYSEEEWKDQDPQIPRSIWYHTDALSVGLRVVRPLVEPTAEEEKAKWDNSLPVQQDGTDKIGK